MTRKEWYELVAKVHTAHVIADSTNGHSSFDCWRDCQHIDCVPIYTVLAGIRRLESMVMVGDVWQFPEDIPDTPDYVTVLPTNTPARFLVVLMQYVRGEHEQTKVSQYTYPMLEARALASSWAAAFGVKVR